MDITEHDNGDYILIEMNGRLDSNTAPQFEDRLMGLLTGQGRSVLADLAGLDFVSSAGLRVMLMGAKKTKGTGQKFVLCGLIPDVYKVFQLSGFDRVLDIQDSREAGEARMQG